MTPEQYLGLDDSALVVVDEKQPSHKLTPACARAFRKMQLAARNDGIDLSIASSYRSIHRQVTLWNEKWQGKRPVYSKTGQCIAINELNDDEKIDAILTWSALPGTSRHHWGTDIDVYDKVGCEASDHVLKLVPEEYSIGGPCHALSQWLLANAQDFGFVFPYNDTQDAYAPEPWHISFETEATAIMTEFDHSHLSETLLTLGLQGIQSVTPRVSQLVKKYVKFE